MVLPPLFRKPLWRGVLLGLLCGLAAWLITHLSLERGLEDWMLGGCFSYLHAVVVPADASR